MALKAVFTGVFIAVWLAAGVLLLWLPARMAPPAEASGPEIPRRRWGPGRRAGAAAFGVLSLVLLGAAWAFSTIEIAPAQPPDFDNDAWVADCSSSFARDTVSHKKRRSLTQSCGSFTGAKTLWRVYDKEGGKEIAIEYQIAVSSGRADLALVQPDGTVTRLSGETSPYTFTTGAGETRLRLIGDGGKVEVSVTIPSMAGNWVGD